MRLRMRVLPVALCVGLLTGCVPQAEPRESPEPPALTSTTGLPDEFLTVIAGADATGSAIATSEALYDTAQLVVTAPAAQLPAQLMAASAAIAVGAPLLLVPSESGGAASVALEDELDRLGATTVLNIGGTNPSPADLQDSRDRLDVDATAAAINALLPRELELAEAPSEQEALAAVARLDPRLPVLFDPGPNPGATPVGESPEFELPRVKRAEPIPGGVVLAVDDPAAVAAVATARSAGLDVLLVPAGNPNPAASGELVTALSEAPPSAVLALGASFSTERALDWKVRAAVSGAQLPGGGQLLFPGHVFVALYGTPGAPGLGVLGEQGLPETLARAAQTAAAYEPLTDRTVVPMLEIIATVAAGAAGSDGNYSNEISVDTLRPWVEAAGEAGMYVVLDLQPGRTDFLTQAKLYEPLLSLPHVGLALDPEWRLKPDQRHLAQIGSVDAAEVNAVVTWLADLTAEHALPQKLLVLHQFQPRMIANRAAVDTSRDELAILIHVDGQGSQPAKQETWRVLQSDAPAGVAWGWKNFYDEDLPPLTPEQTMTQVAPTPDLVTYQ